MSNDGRREIFGLIHREIAFVCECAQASCFDTVALTAAEFDRIRDRGELVLAAGHREPALA